MSVGHIAHLLLAISKLLRGWCPPIIIPVTIFYVKKQLLWLIDHYVYYWAGIRQTHYKLLYLNFFDVCVLVTIILLIF